MIDAMMLIVAMQPTQPPSDGDVFYAPTPDVTFTVPGASSSLTLSDHLSWWLPILAGVAIGVVLGVVATLTVMRLRRRHRLDEYHSKRPHGREELNRASRVF
jgi:hypothetical protein